MSSSDNIREEEVEIVVTTSLKLAVVTSEVEVVVVTTSSELAVVTSKVEVVVTTSEKKK